MSSIEFNFHWESGEGITTPELRETMAGLAIRINGDPVTQVYDAVSRSVRDVIHIPLYPIAEWLATNWFPLFFECPGPGRVNFEKRHVFSSGREGFAVPALGIIPEGNWIDFSWNPGQVPHSDLRFIASGEARLRRLEVMEASRNFVDSVVARLETTSATLHTRLKEEWEYIAAMPADERAFCEAAGALGLDPFSTDEEQDRKIAAASEQLPDSLLQEFFASALWAQFDENLAWVENALSLVADAGESAALPQLRHSIQKQIERGLSATPWEIGYGCAREVRQALGCDGNPLREEELHTMGWNGTQGAARYSDVFNGVAAMDQATQMGQFVVSCGHPVSQRFVFARALFEYLTARQFPRLVTRAATYAQKESRAFAAELLAPSQTLRERITGEMVSPEQVADLAEEFLVSSMVIEHQIANHGIATLSY